MAMGTPGHRAGGQRCTYTHKALLAAVVLAVAVGGGNAQKPPPDGGQQRCVSTLVDDQEAALYILQLLSDPDNFYGWFESSPSDLAHTLGGQPERNPTLWQDGDPDMLLSSAAAWAADAVPTLTSADDPCGFVASMLLCDALPAVAGDPYTLPIGATACSCSCSLVQPADGFGGLTVRHGCPSNGGEEPSLPATWTTFACPRMSWRGIYGTYIVQNGGAALPGSGTDRPIAVLGRTMESCAEACASYDICDGVKFGYDRELHTTFCLLVVWDGAVIPDPIEVVSVADATHAVWQLLYASANRGADEPIDQGFVDAQSQGDDALYAYAGQYSAACYQERMCWTSVCLDQEAVAVRAIGSLSLTNSSNKECATAVVAPEGYQVDWRLDSMTRAAHAAAGQLELYYDVSPHAAVAQVFKGGVSCSKANDNCAVTGRSPGPVLYFRERPGSIEASWKFSWKFVPESDVDCTACVSGCMQSNATNFNPTATVDDRSCSFAGLACGDHVASNYDPSLTLDAPYPGQCTYTCDSLVSRYFFGPGVQEAAHSEVSCFHSGDVRVDEWKASLSNSKRKGITPSTSKLAQRCYLPAMSDELCESATSIDVLLLGASDWLNVSSPSGCVDRVEATGSFIIQGSAYSPHVALQIVASGPKAVLRWVTFTTARCHRHTGPNAMDPMALLLMPGSDEVPVSAVIERCSFVGLSNADQGGAIAASRGSTLHIEHSRFVRCHALSAGALRINEAQVWIRDTIFELNYAETSLVSVTEGYTGTAGAIYAEAFTIQSSKQAHLSLESCKFNNNGVILDNRLDITAVRGGWTIHLDYLDPAIWWILDSEFEMISYNPIFSVFATASGTLSCSQHPCPLGYGCSAGQSSLHCEACSPSQYSGDGIRCAQCPAGKQASANASFCEDCPAGLYSDAVEALRCSRCPEGRRANNQSTGCFAPLCREGDYSTTHAQCLCPFDTYNSSKGTVACLDADGNHLESPLLPGGLHCQPCPPCLICTQSSSTPMIAQGWAHPATSSKLSWAIDGPSRDTRIYTCPHDEDNTRDDPYACRSHPINASATNCANGFAGPLCGTCAVGFTRKNHRDCLSCPDAQEALHSRYISILVPAAIVVLLLVVCTVGKHAASMRQFISAHNLNDVLHCLESSLHIIFSMVQIVSQFSAVLDFSFRDNTPRIAEVHQTIGHMLLDLKVLVELECWGLTEKNTYYGKFLADLVVIPGFLCCLLLIVYTCDCASRFAATRAISRTTSSSGGDQNEQLQSDLNAVRSRTNGAVGWIYTGIFFTLPRMTTTTFSAFGCRDIGDADGTCEKWLEAAYAIDCCSDEYTWLVLGGVVGAATVLALPLGLGVVLTRETRKNWRGYEQARMESEETRNSDSRSPSPSGRAKFPVGLRAFESDEAPSSDYQLNMTLDFFDDMWLFADNTQFHAYNYSQLHEHYNFFVYCYRPGAYYWEIVEVVYKIFMSGFLMFAPGGRGSVGQLFCGVSISFLMGALHVRVWPYKHNADNWLRFAAEVQIFQTLAAALALKSRGSTHSALDALDRATIVSGYDWLLLISFWVLTPVALVVAVCAKLAAHRRARQQNDALLDDVWRASGHSPTSSTGIDLDLLPNGSRNNHEQTMGFELRTLS